MLTQLTPFSFGLPDWRTCYTQLTKEAENAKMTENLNEKITEFNKQISWSTYSNQNLFNEIIDLFKTTHSDLKNEIDSIRKKWCENLVKVACEKSSFLERIYICLKLYDIHENQNSSELRLDLARCVLKCYEKAIYSNQKLQRLQNSYYIVTNALDLYNMNFFTESELIDKEFPNFYHDVCRVLDLLINYDRKLKNNVVHNMLNWIENDYYNTSTRFFYCNAVLRYSPTPSVAKFVIKTAIKTADFIKKMSSQQFLDNYQLNCGNESIDKVKTQHVLALITYATEWSTHHFLYDTYKSKIESIRESCTKIDYIPNVTQELV